MGGAKKKSLAQTEKQQKLQTKKQQREPSKKSQSKVFEKQIGGIDIPNLEGIDVSEELSKMKAITPYAVASKYSLRISIAKNLLKLLEKRGLVKLIAGNSNLKLYRFVGSIPP